MANLPCRQLPTRQKFPDKVLPDTPADQLKALWQEWQSHIGEGSTGDFQRWMETDLQLTFRPWWGFSEACTKAADSQRGGIPKGKHQSWSNCIPPQYASPAVVVQAVISDREWCCCRRRKGEEKEWSPILVTRSVDHAQGLPEITCIHRWYIYIYFFSVKVNADHCVKFNLKRPHRKGVKVWGLILGFGPHPLRIYETCLRILRFANEDLLGLRWGKKRWEEKNASDEKRGTLQQLQCMPGNTRGGVRKERAGNQGPGITRTSDLPRHRNFA